MVPWGVRQALDKDVLLFLHQMAFALSYSAGLCVCVCGLVDSADAG